MGRCYNRRRSELRSRRPVRLDPQALARKIVDIASDKQAEDVVMLDLHDVSLIADYFVICNGTSDRQIKSISDGIIESIAKDDKLKPRRTEGTPDSGWMLLDYGGVVVHIFSPEMRDFYRLEKIWSMASPVIRIA